MRVINLVVLGEQVPLEKREGDYLTMLTDLGEIAAEAIKKAK